MNPNAAFNLGVFFGFVLCIIIINFNPPHDGE